MREPDANEPAAPPKRAGKRIWGDRLLTGTGLILAEVSAVFPWYVFLHPEEFGLHVAEGDRTRDLPDWQGRDVVSVSPLAMANRNPGEPRMAPDPLTTGTISNRGAEDDKDQPNEDQPFPGKVSFRLLHVANGRALIEDVSGMYLVRVGSVLPDNSRLASIEQRDGKWVIVTSAGDVYGRD